MMKPNRFAGLAFFDFVDFFEWDSIAAIAFLMLAFKLPPAT